MLNGNKTDRRYVNGNNNQSLNSEKSIIGNNLRKPIWDLKVLSPFMKDFYQPHDNVKNRYVFNKHFHFLTMFYIIICYLIEPQMKLNHIDQNCK